MDKEYQVEIVEQARSRAGRARFIAQGKVRSMNWDAARKAACRVAEQVHRRKVRSVHIRADKPHTILVYVEPRV